MSTTAKSPEFKVGEHVVYPSQGVGVITAIEDSVFNGEKLKYYIIYIKSSDMKERVPVRNAKKTGIRAIVSSQEAMKAIESIADKDIEPPVSDWKDRFKQNQQQLREGSIASFAKVVRTLYHRSKVKELPVAERRLYDSALGLLIDEASFATKQKPEDIKKLVFSKLEPDAGKKAKTVVKPVVTADEIAPHPEDRDDDDVFGDDGEDDTF